MKLIRLISVLLISFHSMIITAQSNNDCTIVNKAFNAGETITYKVVYNWNSLWINAGEVSFAVTGGVYGTKNVYHVIGSGTTYKSYDWFYKVRDTYESFIDKETLQPLKFVRNVDEGGYKIYNNVTFKHTEGKAISTHGTFDIPNCIQDVLSAIYFARNIDFKNLKPNDTIPMNMFLDDSVYHIFIKYNGKEQIKTSLGTFNCIKFSPRLIEGTLFKQGDEMSVWVTDDDNKIPVLVESPIIVGSIRAEVHKIEGARNPLKSKIGK